ncbi:MAG: hypothetical protein ABJ084_01165 [Halioglobus sp.]
MHHGIPLIQRLLITLAAALLVACSSSPKKVAVESTLPEQAVAWPAPVRSVPLLVTNSPPQPLLDVGVAIFDAGVPADESTHSKLGIFPKIRAAEAKYIPVFLRQVLVESGAWGAVRVLPEPGSASNLQITGTIVHSDGLRLVLDIEAIDASGRTWLSKTYHDEATASDYPVGQDGDPYLDLYHAIANDLVKARVAIDERVLVTLPAVTEMRYAATLSPDAFAGYLQTAPDGTLTAARLPASNDPMLMRVKRIQNQEYLFIDTVDEQYLNLYEAMGPTYDLWRQYGREQAIYKQEYQQRVAGRDKYGRRGTFIQMEQTYNAFKLTKIQEQDLDELASGFSNEVAPTIMESSGKVFRLSGTLDTQYTEWQSILKQIFALETGLPPTE